MYIRFLIVSLLLCVSATAFCQKKKDKEKPVAETDVTRSRFQINDIKDRGIIVRLRTDLDRLKALRAQGYKGAADELENRNHLINLQLCYAFITQWSYGPVYFMESQHTAQLQRDSLVALTWDLQRDTVIHILHDSIYLVDYGTLMETVREEDGTSVTGTTPLAGSYLVTKGADQQQLTAPLPFYAKVWGDRVISTTTLLPVSIPGDVEDSIRSGLSAYHTTQDLISSPYKNVLARYMMALYDHIQVGPVATGKQNPKPWSTSYSDATERYNEHFIEYYCKRLDKDKSIIYSQSPIYWWLRNPNIRYLLYLKNLELRLKESLGR